MIYVVEAFVEDYLHVLANVNLIKIFKNVYPNEPFVFISAEKHNVKVEKNFEGQNNDIIFQSIKNLAASENFFVSVYRVFYRFYRDLRLLYTIFKKCKPNDKIVVTHIHFMSLVLLKLIKKRYPEITAFSIIHGDVEYAYYPNNLRQKVVGFFHKLMFKIDAKNFYYVFLTPISKKILVESKWIKSDDIFAIELPSFPNENKYISNEYTQNKTIKIGHIGSAGLRKNVQLFYQLASRIKDSISEERLEFSVVGVLDNSISSFLNPLVIDYVDGQVGKPLLRDVYDEKVSNLHYSIFFYGKNDFILRSSAAFFDAIFFEKPIIALRNTFFEDIFKREGDIGYLCEDLEEMRRLMIDFTDKREIYDDKYIVLLQNIKKYKAKLSIIDISFDLKKEIESRKIIEV
ncbi:hypothetical protein [Flavobacterium johnsoniae]|uniref:hypothetical protein n=1 Tax=Flavobacterium johnsoniae TaxID=986 RepID=UPI003D96EF9E